MYSRKGQKTTYSSRKRHRSSSNPVPTSSPVKPAVLLDDDMSVAEMTTRMKKRSRAALRHNSGGGATQSDGAEQNGLHDEVERPSKRRRGMLSDSRTPLNEKPLEINTPSAPIQQYLDTHMEEDEEALKTPAARIRPPVVQPSKSYHETEPLSPLPASARSRRVLKTRASSKYLKENIPQNPRSLLTATSLASPFHSQHTTPVTSPKPNAPVDEMSTSIAVVNAQKNSRTKFGTGRTRSAASTLRRPSNRSGPNSPSVHSNIHRRPSESNLQAKNRQQWLVPAQTDEVAKKRSAYRPSRLNQSISREGSFFDAAPQACSTPLHPIRTARGLQYDTDMTPRLPFHLANTDTPLVRDASMGTEDDTPRVSMLPRTSAFRAHSNDSIFGESISPEEGEQTQTNAIIPPLYRKGMRRATVHIPEDSIFSSAIDFSVSIGPNQPRPTTVDKPDSSNSPSDIVLPHSVAAPPSSPTVQGSPLSSEGGDDLRDMFSILGLDGAPHC